MAFTFLSNLSSAFYSLKGVQIKQCISLSYLDAVLSQLDVLILICQYSLFAPKIEDIVASPSELVHCPYDKLDANSVLSLRFAYVHLY